jgi:transcriptional regulator with XRE-family HTH domain
MSVECLAEIVGADAAQMRRYEAGDERVKADHLLRIARALDEKVPYFFEGAPAEAGETLQSDEVFEIVRAFVKIHDPIKRRSILDLARLLSSAQNAGSDTL